MKICNFFIILLLSFLLQGCFSPEFVESFSRKNGHQICWDKTDPSCGSHRLGKEMVEGYLDHPFALKARVEGRDQKLEYLRIPMSSVKELIAKGNLDSNDELVIMFATTFETRNNIFWNKKFTILMASAKNNSGTMEIQTNPVYNVFSPCPDKCLKYSNPAHRPGEAKDCRSAEHGEYCNTAEFQKLEDEK